MVKSENDYCEAVYSIQGVQDDPRALDVHRPVVPSHNTISFNKATLH